MIDKTKAAVYSAVIVGCLVFWAVLIAILVKWL